MRLSKIRISRVSASLLILLLMGFISLLPSRLAAQCTGPVQSSTQTVTMTGSGGNLFAPTFSQYNPPGGYLLISAVLQTSFNIFGTVNVSNSTNSAQTVIAGYADDDEITLNGSTFMNANGQNSSGLTGYTNYFISVNPMGSTAVGPQTIVPQTTLENDSITTANSALNDFSGTGSPDIQYYNYVFQQTTNSSVGVSTDFAVNITFNLTYYYCNTEPLAINLINFAATLENPQLALLNWLTAGETPGEKYVVQVSTGNGTDFVNADTVLADGVAGNGNYTYEYAIPSTDKGNLYFRIEMIDANGTVSYSPLRVVNLGNGAATAFSIYPNPPTTFINLTFPGNSQNWEVQIYAANGDLVQQNYFSNTNLATLNFNHKMAAGAYFVRAISPQTNEHYAASFVIKD